MVAQVIASEDQARGRGTGLVGMNLEDGAKVPLWPGASHFTELAEICARGEVLKTISNT